MYVSRLSTLSTVFIILIIHGFKSYRKCMTFSIFFLIKQRQKRQDWTKTFSIYLKSLFLPLCATTMPFSPLLLMTLNTDLIIYIRHLSTVEGKAHTSWHSIISKLETTSVQTYQTFSQSQPREFYDLFNQKSDSKRLVSKCFFTTHNPVSTQNLKEAWEKDVGLTIDNGTWETCLETFTLVL